MVAMSDGARWYVVVEENLRAGNSKQWMPSVVRPAGYDLAQAHATALHTAWWHTPSHPMSPRKRQVLRLPDGTYLVVVTGRTSKYHFRVSVAEWVPPPAGAR